ncbi:aminotransferase class I/II-fold pyridoxal phosphate-dependent enzyme [Paenibacillus sp. HJL G12]|uniref:Aminotransferase class I/II-fold pyridoxal phosphate-dependent enzyme n=1 Tax=Paenibacillus dendrobii TaxID=2691084 RepID=A0A7X3IFA1_9BACL|nr:PLP-dependent aminotransferase family protein [Paenibacillus dendrobii]MWV42431.1 aminotransferase class I/II-fold pyridoxal phosphate-dependent enzyme [Paenibacillus dendrobii]
MNWKPEMSSELPIYRQIYEYYEGQIRSGVLLSGTRLPTERELARLLSVNRSTVTTAYDELRSSGLIESRQGSGTRVSGYLWETKPVSHPYWHRSIRRKVFDMSESLRHLIHESLPEGNVIHMIRGELSPDLMPQEMLEHASQCLSFDVPFSYFSDWRGDAQLRETLSHFLAERMNIRANPGNILITNGVKHALSLIARTLLQPGDAIAVEGPSYLYSMQVFAEEGLRMVKLEVDEEGLIPEQLPMLYQQFGVRMVFTNPTYQNPTGISLSIERRQKLLKICKQLNIPIVEDDPYSLLHLEEEDKPLPSIQSLDENGQHVIYISTLSKFATPGMRIGYVAAPLQVIDKLAQTKNRTGYSSSHMGEQLAQRFLTDEAFDAHLNKVRRELARRRERMLQAIQREAGDYIELVAPHAPAGGYYLWLRLKEETAADFTEKTWIEQAIRHGITFYPGSVFGEGGGKLRLTYASLSMEEIERGIHRLGGLLKEMYGR